MDWTDKIVWMHNSIGIISYQQILKFLLMFTTNILTIHVIGIHHIGSRVQYIEGGPLWALNILKKAPYIKKQPKCLLPHFSCNSSCLSLALHCRHSVFFMIKKKGFVYWYRYQAQWVWKYRLFWYRQNPILCVPIWRIRQTDRTLLSQVGLGGIQILILLNLSELFPWHKVLPTHD